MFQFWNKILRILEHLKILKFFSEPKPKSNKLTLIETWKSGDIQSDNDSEEKIQYMQTFRFIKVKRYHEGNENQRKVCIYGIFSS